MCQVGPGEVEVATVVHVLMEARRRVGVAAVFVASALAAGCGDHSQDPNVRVTGIYEGRLESDLRREIGPPTREQRVADTDRNAPCRMLTSGGQGDRQLTYDVPSQGFEKRIRELFGVGPASRGIVCVDSKGTIVDVWFEVK